MIQHISLTEFSRVTRPSVFPLKGDCAGSFHRPTDHWDLQDGRLRNPLEGSEPKPDALTVMPYSELLRNASTNQSLGKLGGAAQPLQLCPKTIRCKEYSACLSFAQMVARQDVHEGLVVRDINLASPRGRILRHGAVQFQSGSNSCKGCHRLIFRQQVLAPLNLPM